jgi:hypothetical protein
VIKKKPASILQSFKKRQALIVRFATTLRFSDQSAIMRILSAIMR